MPTSPYLLPEHSQTIRKQLSPQFPLTNIIWMHLEEELNLSPNFCCKGHQDTQSRKAKSLGYFLNAKPPDSRVAQTTVIDSSIHDKNSKGNGQFQNWLIQRRYSIIQHSESFHFSVLWRSEACPFVCKMAATVPGNSCTFDIVDRNKQAYFFVLSFGQRKPYPKCLSRPSPDLLTRIVLFICGLAHHWQKKQH